MCLNDQEALWCVDVGAVGAAAFIRHKSLTCLLQLVGDEVSQVCYSFFMDESNGQAVRLEALKCIGYVLSMRRSSDVMVSCPLLSVGGCGTSSSE